MNGIGGINPVDIFADAFRGENFKLRLSARESLDYLRTASVGTLRGAAFMTYKVITNPWFHTIVLPAIMASYPSGTEACGRNKDHHQTGSAQTGVDKECKTECMHTGGVQSYCTWVCSPLEEVRDQ